MNIIQASFSPVTGKSIWVTELDPDFHVVNSAQEIIKSVTLDSITTVESGWRPYRSGLGRYYGYGFYPSRKSSGYDVFLYLEDKSLQEQAVLDIKEKLQT